MKKFKYYQYVLIEWHNSQHETIKLVSNKSILPPKVTKYLKKEYFYDEIRDSFQFIDKPKTVIL